MDVSTAELMSCVIMTTDLRKGREVSEAGEQRSKVILAGRASRKFWLRVPQQRAGRPATTHRTGLQNSIVSTMLSQLKTKGICDSSTPNGIIVLKREKPRHGYEKEGNPQNNLRKEATVLGIIQILCCLLISSLGAILVSGPYSSHVKPTISTILMSGYPFVGALCFAITGSLSIISGKKSTKPFAMSSLISNVVSSLAAGAGLFLLADGLVALGTVSQRCDSEREYLSSLPYSMYYYAIYEFKECLLASVSLTGLLVVMLIFTVLELLMAAYASTLWWKEVHSNNPGSAFSLPLSLGHIQQAKKLFQVMDRSNTLEEKGGEIQSFWQSVIRLP